jgi:glycosyltransferase involved in cell wall biosynthesis
MKRKVLIMAGYYVPSVKGGGPIQSIKNLVDNLSDRIDFCIVAADRDLGDKEPFKNIVLNEWVKVGSVKVFYTDKSKLSWKVIKNLITSLDFDVIYLNSFFAYKDGIIPILLNKIHITPKKKLIMAPRGQFTEGALGMKSLKKMLYINFSTRLGLYKDVIWHATTQLEKAEIHRIFGGGINVKIARNLTPNYQDRVYNKNLKKNIGELKLAYISRIHPMKNLYQVLDILKRFDSKIEFNIYGPIEDHVYWEKCKKLISQMNVNVNVLYNGPISNDKVNEVYQKNHISILLTLGENFGHAISEALIGGCPVIISNKTPWRDLENVNSGWDLPLDDSDLIEEKIRYFIGLDENQYRYMSKCAFKFGKNESNQIEDFRSYDNMFNTE